MSAGHVPLLEHNRLVEFLAVLGPPRATSALLPWGREFYDNEGHSLFPEPSSDVPYTPSTLHLLPPDINKPAMINNLHLFCYPEGMYIRAVGEAEPPKFHPFVMTDELADIKYGACISFDVPLAADDPSQPPPKWRPEASSAAVVSASASASVVFPRVPSKPSIVDQLPTSLKLMASRSSETTGGSDRFSTETPSSSPASSLSQSGSAENLIAKQKIAAAAARGGLHNRSEDDCLPSIGFEVSPSSSAGMLDSPDSPKSIFSSPPDTPQSKSAISPSSSVVELQSATSIKSSASRVTFQSRGRATSISELVDQPTRPRSRSPNPLRRAPQQPSNSLPSSSTLSSSPPSSSNSSTSSLPATTSSQPLPANALSPVPMRKATGKLHALDPSKRPVSSLHSASMAPSLSAMKPVLPPLAPKPQRWPLAMPKITPFASPAPQSQPEWLGRCSICIVSRWPFFEFFREYLTTILYLAEQPGGMACPIEHYFKCLVYSAPVPPPTAAVLGLGLSFTIEDIKLPPLSRPALFDFPAIDFPLRFIFKALDIENVLLIIAAILTEKKILFVSSSYSLLTYAAESFVSLIYPLTWSPHTYVPILPLKLIEAVQAPTPFIMGLHSAHIAEISEQSRQGLVVVALDQNIVMSSTDLAEVPRKESRLLSSILMRILHPEIVDMDLVQLPKTASAPTPDNFRWQNFQIRLAFLSFTASLLTDYRQYTQTSDFDIGGFLGTKDASSQAFFSQFTETQGFQNLLRDSMISGPPPLISRLLDCTAQADTIDSLLLLLYHGSRCPGTKDKPYIPLINEPIRWDFYHQTILKYVRANIEYTPSWPYQLDRSLMVTQDEAQDMEHTLKHVSDAILSLQIMIENGNPEPTQALFSLYLLRATILAEWHNEGFSAITDISRAMYLSSAQSKIPKRDIFSALRRIVDTHDFHLLLNPPDHLDVQLPQIHPRIVRYARVLFAELKAAKAHSSQPSAPSGTPGGTLLFPDSGSLNLCDPVRILAKLQSDSKAASPSQTGTHRSPRSRSDPSTEEMSRLEFSRFAWQVGLAAVEHQAQAIFEALCSQKGRNKVMKMEKMQKLVPCVREIFKKALSPPVPYSMFMQPNEMMLFAKQGTTYRGRRGFLMLSNLRLIFIIKAARISKETKALAGSEYRHKSFSWNQLLKIERFNFKLLVPPGVPCIRVQTFDSNSAQAFTLFSYPDRDALFIYLKEIWVASQLATLLDMPQLVYSAVSCVILAEAVQVVQTRPTKSAIFAIFQHQEFPNVNWSLINSRLQSQGILNLPDFTHSQDFSRSNDHTSSSDDEDNLAVVLPPHEAIKLSQKLLRAAMSLLYSHSSSECEQGWDFEAMQRDKGFHVLNLLASRLHELNTADLTAAELFCFFVNVYNTLVVHAFIYCQTFPASELDWHVLSKCSYYSIGFDQLSSSAGERTHAYSLTDILHGILRANHQPSWLGSPVFSSEPTPDPRLRPTPLVFDPRVHFVISHHTTASPAIWLLTPDRMEHQLNLAHTEFVQDMVSANVDKGIISLPALFQTYAGDFGGDTRVMDEWVLPHLHPSVRHSVESVLQNPSRQIEYLEDWDIACKPFRSTYV